LFHPHRMTSSQTKSGSTLCDGFEDKEQRLKRPRNRNRRLRVKSRNIGKQSAGSSAKPSARTANVSAKRPSSAKPSGRSLGQTPRENVDDGWQIKKKKKRRNKNNRNNKGQRKSAKTKAAGRGRGRTVPDKAHILEHDPSNDDVKENEYSAVPLLPRSSCSSPRDRMSKRSDSRNSQSVEEDADAMESGESRDSTDLSNTTASSVDATPSAESRASSHSVAESVEATPSSLDPEIAEFEPTALSASGDSERAQKELQSAIQLQLFGELQALNLQKQHIQTQIDWVLKARFSELDRLLAQLRAQPNTDHTAYYLLRRQQQAVEQQIASNQWAVRQIAERIAYTRDAYARQAERVGAMEYAQKPQ